jgi:TonB family protein
MPHTVRLPINYGVMVTWIIEPAISIGFFYLAYLLFLRNLAFFQVNRVYFLVAIIFSLLLPLITVTPPVTIGNYTSFIQEVTITAQVQGNAIAAGKQPFDYGKIIPVIYLAGAVLLGLRFLTRIAGLALLISGNRTTRHRHRHNHIVSIESDQSPFSFLNYIFINESLYREEERKKIIEHELVHIRQFHSFDLILLELLTIVQWFNPVAWLIRRSMLEIHEYLADEQVIRTGTSIPAYQSLLVALQVGNGSFPLANNFNRSLTLSRIRMMTRIKPAGWKKLNVVILLPALILLVFMCTKAENKMQAASVGIPYEAYSASPDISLLLPAETVDGPGITVAPQTDDLQIAANAVSRETAAPPATRDPEPPSASVSPNLPGKDTPVIPETGQVRPETANRETSPPEQAGSPPPAVIAPGMEGQSAGQSRRETGAAGLPASEVFFIVEDMPEFQGGGPEYFRQFISENLRYPQAAANNGIHGRVFVQFVVQPDGTVADAKIVRGVDPLLDREALRVVMSSPKWTPGMQRGQPVAVAFTFPINFVLQPLMAGIISY